MRRTRQSNDGKGIVCLRHRFVDRHAYVCLTARTLAMTGKNAHRFVDRWPRHGQCAYMCLTTRTLAMTGKMQVC